MTAFQNPALAKPVPSQGGTRLMAYKQNRSTAKEEHGLRLLNECAYLPNNIRRSIPWVLLTSTWEIPFQERQNASCSLKSEIDEWGFKENQGQNQKNEIQREAERNIPSTIKKENRRINITVLLLVNNLIR